MNIDAILAGLPDLDDDALVPQSPRTDDLVPMDRVFENSDYAIVEDTAPAFSKDAARPMRKQAVVRACRTESELRELDAEMLKSVGVEL